MTHRGYGCEIRGTGSAFGSLNVSSADLERRLGLEPGWVVERTGVASRHVIAANERTLDLAVRAGKQALEDAQLAPEQLDLVICATMTPEMPCPSTAHRLASQVGTRCGAFDLTSACTGFLAAMNIAATGIAARVYRNVLVVGADALTPTIDNEDPKMISLFGDAAGAAIVSRCDDVNLGCIVQHLGCDGGRWETVYHPRCAADLPAGTPEPKRYGLLTMNGLAVFRFAVSTLARIIPEALDAAGLSLSDLDLVLIHQSNLRILQSVCKELGLTEAQCPSIIQHTGNTSGGSVGVLLDTVRRDGRLHPGMTIMLAAVGGGLSWGASVWRV